MKPNPRLLVLLSFAVLAACQKAPESPAPGIGDECRISAGIIDLATRTWLDSESGSTTLSVYWSSGDRVNVNGQNSAPLTVPSGEKLRAAEFLLRSVAPPYNVIYPAEIVSGTTYNSDGTVEITIPSVQTYRPGSFGEGAAILYGYSRDAESQLMLNNLCSAVRVQLWGSASTLIRDCSMNAGAESVAGKFTLKPEDGTLTPVEGTSSVSLDLGEGVNLHPDGSWFYFTLPAKAYPDGIQFVFTQASDRRYMLCKWTPDSELEAGVLYSFKDVEFVPGAKDIENADDWNEFALCVAEGGDMRKWLRDGTVHLAADISADDLIQVAEEFSWEFDGQGHSISRNSGSASLFRKLSGTVKNLSLGGSVIGAGGTMAVLADTLLAGGAIVDCTNNASLLSDSGTSSKAGAFAGVMAGGSISGCTNNGSLTLKADCSAGTIEGVLLGGIVGEMNASLPGSSDALLENCRNDGTLTVDPIYTLTTHTYGFKAAGLGGIVGWLRGEEHAFVLNNCDNSGNLTFSGEHVASASGLSKYQISAGGIVGIGGDLNADYGIFYSTVGEHGIDASLSDCDNSGVIHNCGINYSGSAETNTKVYTGGIAGSLVGKETKMAGMLNCTNTGSLIPYDLFGDQSSTRPLYSQVAGGLIGYGGFVDMDHCTVSCQIGNGKRQMYSIAGAIGLVLRRFSLTNSTIWFTGYFNRYSGNNHTNSASVAVPPVKFGSSAVSPSPSLGAFVITGCALGAKLYYYNAPNTGKDDYSGNCTSSTMLTSVSTSAIRGWEWKFTEPYCSDQYNISNNTNLNAAP